MKTIFFTGKGGVGKSTLSSAVSWQLAARGRRVLAVSFDPAHNLGDIFGLSLSNRKKRFNPNLYLVEIDLEQAASKYVRENLELLQGIYSYMKPFNMEKYFKILKYSPGIEEYALLTSLEGILRTEKDFDYIIFDTPPTGLTMRILALPRVTLAWIERLSGMRREILDKRHTIHNIMGQPLRLAYKPEDDAVLRKLTEMNGRYSNLKNRLEGSDNSIVIVFNPDYLSLRESQRLKAGLEELNLPLRVAINNKLSPENQGVAAAVERELLGNPAGIRLERVAAIPHPQPACYIMEHDLAALFS